MERQSRCGITTFERVGKRDMKFKKRKIKLKKDHLWEAPKGYQLLVMERGAVHVCFPRGWLIKPKHDTMCIHDVEPPDDNCRIQISMFRFHPIAVGKMPFEKIVRQVLSKESDTDFFDIKPIVFQNRPGMKMAWIERKYIDPDFHRPILSRTFFALENNIQVLISFDCWNDDAVKFQDVWEQMLKTLKLGHYVSDPSTGQTHVPRLN